MLNLNYPDHLSSGDRRADSLVPVDSDITVEGTVLNERHKGEPEISPPHMEDVQEKIDPFVGQLAGSENDKHYL